MPCLKQRGARVFRVEIGPNLASHLSLPDHLRERRCPLGENVTQASADEFTMLRGFQRHVPRQASMPLSRCGEELGNRVEVGAKTLHGSPIHVAQRLCNY